MNYLIVINFRCFGKMIDNTNVVIIMRIFSRRKSWKMILIYFLKVISVEDIRVAEMGVDQMKSKCSVNKL